MLAEHDGAISGYLQWVLGIYASEFRARTKTLGHGHVFQRRFWSDPMTDFLHFLMVLRYIEANPYRASLVARAEDWPWSSIVLRKMNDRLLDPLPFALPDAWSALVNTRQPSVELKDIRFPKPRGRRSDDAPSSPPPTGLDATSTWVREICG